MDAAPRVSVVICAHDDARFELLRAAVRSVAAQDPPPAELLVVVDHNDRLLARARQVLPGTTVIANEQAAGLSGARNTGIGRSTGSIIAFMDDDATARPGWLAALVAAYEDPGVLGAGGTILPAWQTTRPAWFPEEFLWVVGCTYRGYPTERSRVRNPIGCNMSFRREVFERVGGFRQGVGRGRGLPLGCEETELCARAARQLAPGYFVHEPNAIVDHVVPPSRGRLRYYLVRSLSEGISKAYVVRLVGAEAGMQTERRYATRTLPAGFLRHLLAPLRGSAAGPLRAGAILVGLPAFGFGYLRGMIRFRNDALVNDGASVPWREE